MFGLHTSNGISSPVESFNIGKKGEHKQRVHFRENPC